MKILFCLLALSATYVELDWLKAPGVEATADYAAPSRDTEYKRARMTLKCLEWILNGEYDAFTGHGRNHLERADFQCLQSWAESLKHNCPYDLTATQVEDVMRAALVLGDIGKSPVARRRFPHLTHIQDHDEFYKAALPYMQCCPTFASLPPAGQKLLLDCSHAAHYGHICHVEGGPSMFADLNQIKPYCLEFDLLVNVCDVAGAAGHVEDSYSLVYDHNVHMAMQSVRSACLAVASGVDAKEALMQYLRARGSLLGLDPDDQKERTLIRLACMLRLFSKAEGEQLKIAVGELDLDTIAAFDPLIDREGPTPTYMPAVLCNLKSCHNLGYAVKYGLPAVAKILKACQGELNFNPLALQIRQNPHCLEDGHAVDQFIQENRAN